MLRSTTDYQSSHHYAGLRPDWLRTGVISGFIATFTMTVVLTLGYLFANGVGDESGGTFARWLANLSENELTRRVGDQFAIVMVLNLVVGVAWALIYARYFEPSLQHAGVREGLLYSFIPWLVSVVLVFPLMGAGFLGFGLDAGPMPLLGNLVIHLAFGITLGWFFALEESDWIGTSDNEHNAAQSAEQGAAIGIAVGGTIGFVIGWLVYPGMEDLGSRPVIGLAGALSGSAVGTLIGSLLSLGNAVTTPTSSEDGSKVVQPAQATVNERS